MSIRRVVPDIPSRRIDASREFYVGLLGFVVTFASPTNPTAQITIMRDDDSSRVFFGGSNEQEAPYEAGPRGHVRRRGRCRVLTLTPQDPFRHSERPLARRAASEATPGVLLAHAELLECGVVHGG